MEKFQRLKSYPLRAIINDVPTFSYSMLMCFRVCIIFEISTEFYIANVAVLKHEENDKFFLTIRN